MAKYKLEEFFNSPLYRCELIHPERKNVTGYLNKPISLSTQSDWSAMAEFPSVSRGLYTMQAASGRTAMTWIGTSQAWQGTQPVNVSIGLTFVAIENSWEEVHEPCMRLLGWPLPEDKAQWPVIKTPLWLGLPGESGGYIHALIGDHLIIDSLLPQSVTIDHDKVMDKGGIPVKAEVTIDFVTSCAMAATDIERWYIG